LQRLHKYDDAVSSIRILDRNRHEGADLPHCGFLREGNDRPSRSKAAETSDEIAPVHVEGLSVTLAFASASLGTVRPMA
jgi:hypothetical protein